MKLITKSCCVYSFIFLEIPLLFSSSLFITFISDMIENVVMKLTAFAQLSHWLVQKYMNIDNVIAFCRSHEENEEIAFQKPPTPHFHCSPSSSSSYALLTLCRSRILFIREKTEANEIIFAVLDVLRKLMRFLRKRGYCINFITTLLPWNSFPTVKYLVPSLAFNFKSLTENYWDYQAQLLVFEDICFYVV